MTTPKAPAHTAPKTPAVAPKGVHPVPVSEPAKKKSGRKAKDPVAPHGHDGNGKPLAPYGYLPNGNPRQYRQRETSKFSAADLLKPSEVTEEIAEATAPKAPRSEEQKAMDSVVAALIDKAIAAKWPTEWKQLPKARYEIKPEMVSDFKFLVNKAAMHHKVGVRYGSVVENAKTGLSIVVFGVRKRSERASDES